MGATICPPTSERKMRARGAQVGLAEPLGRTTPPGSYSTPNFVFESPQTDTSHFHTCQAAERMFSPGFGFKMILSFSFLPHLHLDLLNLIPSTTLIIPHGRQGNHPVQRSLIHVRPRGRALAGEPRPCSHGNRPRSRAHRQDDISSHPCTSTKGGGEGRR